MAGSSSQLITPQVGIWTRMDRSMQENAASDRPWANGFVGQERTQPLLPRRIAQ
jgi:hypothetical protein